MHAEKSVVKISRSYKKFIRELSAIKYEMEKEAYEHSLRKEGRAEGLAEGRNNEKLQIARNALAKGLTPDFVRDITGLDLETIRELRN